MSEKTVNLLPGEAGAMAPGPSGWALLRTTSTAKAKKEFSADREFARLMWVGLTLLGIAVLGVALASINSVLSRSLGVTIVTLVTGGVGGAAIGFLFGIPRVLTDAYSGAVATAADETGKSAGGLESRQVRGSESRRLLASNSNLEQVSDWLTKIILGVGLTQFYQLDGLLYRFEMLIARYVGSEDRVTPLVATIVMVFSILCGFLAMYLETRLVLSRIFNSVEEDLARRVEKAETEAATAKTQVVEERAQKVDAVERAEKLETAVQKIADASATSATDLAPAADVLQSAASSDQASAGLKSIAAQALAASGRTGEASDLIPSGDGASIKDRIAAMLVALYKEDGYCEVLQIADELSGSLEAKSSADFWFYQAAAFGQQHHALLIEAESGRRTLALKNARDNALKCVRSCLEIDPSFAIRLYRLMHPELSSPQDDDLVDFADDPGFLELIPAPPGSKPPLGT